MSLTKFLKDQKLYDQVLTELPLLHGADLVSTFSKTYAQIKQTYPHDLAQIIGPKAGMQFLQDHFQPYDISRVLLTLRPASYKSKSLSHLIEVSEQNSTDNAEALYITALYYFRAFEDGRVDDDVLDDIIDYLDHALSLNPISDPHRLPSSISENDNISASRCYALQGDAFMMQQERGQAIGAYDYASYLQPDTLALANPKANMIITYQKSMALWYIGQHIDALALLHEIIQSLGFFVLHEDDSPEEDKELEIEDISLSVQYSLQFLLVALDMEDPDYDAILIELEDIENIIETYDLPVSVKELYYFCRGLYHAAPVLEGSDADTALEYFQGIPVHPPGPYWPHINKRLATGMNQKINLVPRKIRSIEQYNADTSDESVTDA